MGASPEWAPLARVSIGGVDVVTGSRREITDAMIKDVVRRRGAIEPSRTRLVFDLNGHALSLKETDPGYRRNLERADVVHADGGFLVTLSRWLTPARIAERSATTDLMYDFAARSETEPLSFFLLGATEDVNRACAERLAELYPQLRIAGRHHGFFSESEEAGIIAKINGCRPDVLWVGLSKPIEQAFAVRYADVLDAAWTVTCGGCFNFVSGDYKRAPKLVQRLNLEWLYRLLSAPRRLFWRYAVTSPHAIWIVLKNARRGRPAA